MSKGIKGAREIQTTPGPSKGGERETRQREENI